MKVQSASGAFGVILATRRIKDAPVVWHVLSSEFSVGGFFFGASSPLEFNLLNCLSFGDDCSNR